METRLRFLIVLAVVLVPSTASANAGTPLMWATMLHLFLGNAVIGLVEGILLERLFKCGVRRSILILITANYLSAWVGYGMASGGLGKLPEITIETVRFWSWTFFVIAFLVTLLIELPFVRWVMSPQTKSFWQVVKAAVIVNAISYALLFGWYWGASGTSMMTQLQVVPASSLVQGDEYGLFFISTDGDQILKADMNGGRQSKLSEVRALHRNDRLFARRNATEGYDLLVYLDLDGGNDEREALIASCFSSFAPLNDNPNGALSNYGQVPSLVPDSDWEFHTGFWAFDGIRGKNKRTGAKVHYALETPYSMWNVRNATQIEGDMVVFQLGKSQICALHPESRRIALLARGKGPIVAKRATAN